MSDPKEGQAALEDLSGITEEDLLGDEGEPSSTQETSETAIPRELSSRISAAKINVDQLPPAIKDDKLALEVYVSAVEERQKDLQRDYTRKTTDLKGIKEKAEAFDILAANPDFQGWVDRYKRGENAMSEGKLTFDDAPAGLKGEALLDWYLEQKLESMGIKNLPTEIAHVKQHLTASQIQNLRDKYPDFQENEREIAQLMTETGLRDPVRAYKLVKAEKGPTVEDLKKELKAEMLADIRKSKEDAGGITRGSSRAGSVERPIIDKDIRTADKDAIWQSLIDSLDEEVSIES